MLKLSPAYSVVAMSAAFAVMPALAQKQQNAPPPLSFVTGIASAEPKLQDKWIKFEGDARVLMIISIILNGQRLMAVIDTGMPTIMVDRDWARRHGVRYQPYGKAGGINGSSAEIGIAPIGSLQIGGFRQVGGAIEVGDLKALSTTIGTQIDAIVGADFLSAYAITIDFDKRRMRFQPSGSARPSGNVVAIESREPGHRFITKIVVGTRVLSPVTIDTGDAGSLGITRDAWNKSGVCVRMTNIASIGWSGDKFLSDIARLDDVRFGGRRFDKVPVTFERLPLDGVDEARIGLKLLDRFNLFLDMGQRVMILSPRSVAPKPTPVTMLGIQGISTDAGLQIAHVMKGSPAEASGLRPGERVCAIDGTRIRTHKHPPKHGLGDGPVGKVVSLTMCDGRKLAITLKEFY
jgi:Aspartyl protease/PDZ domain